MKLKIRKTRKSQAGINTLILFLAIILTVTIAAGVILQTSLSLQNQALNTGSKAKESVGNSLTIRNVYGEDGTTSALTEVYTDIQLTGGSSGLALDSLNIQLTGSSNSTSYAYGNNVSSCDAATASPGKFDVEYVLEGTSFQSGYLQQGDFIRVCFNTFNLTENHNFMLTFIPKNGQQKIIDFATPSIYETKSVPLYP